MEVTSCYLLPLITHTPTLILPSHPRHLPHHIHLHPSAPLIHTTSLPSLDFAPSFVSAPLKETLQASSPPPLPDPSLPQVREALLSLEDAVKPSPYSPVQGADAIRFVFASVGLLLAFWVGNYLAPDLIFSKTVFLKQAEDQGKTPTDGNLSSVSDENVQHDLNSNGRSKSKEVVFSSTKTDEDCTSRIGSTTGAGKSKIDVKLKKAKRKAGI